MGVADDKRSVFRCPKFWRRVVPLFVVALVALAAMSVLCFGNSQWHKYIYLFQLHVYPKYDRFISAPPDYTGMWTDWYSGGQGWCKTQYKKGKVHGKMVNYFYSYANGQKYDETTFQNGRREGLSIQWHENGRKRGRSTFKDGVSHGVWTMWDASGNITSVTYDLYGKEVTKSQYLAACAKDPTLPKPPPPPPPPPSSSK